MRAWIALIVVGCSTAQPLPGPQTVRVISAESELIGGLEAAGRIGDFLIDNGRVRFVVQPPGSSTGWGLYGGSLVDLDRTGPGGDDRLQEIFFQCNLRGFAPQTAEIVNDGATLRLKGIDKGIPLLDAIIPSVPNGLDITIDLTLAANSDTLEISYDVADTAREELRDVSCGAVLLHGDEYDFFTPGKGAGIEGGDLEWVASSAPGARASYVLFRAQGTISAIAAFDEVVPLSSSTQGVFPGGRFRDKLFIAVGSGDVETALVEMRKTRIDPAARQTFTVPVQGPEARLKRVTVTVRDPSRQAGGDAESLALVDPATGKATLSVPSGTARVVDVKLAGRLIATRELSASVEPVVIDDEGTLIVNSRETKAGQDVGPTPVHLFVTKDGARVLKKYLKASDEVVLPAGNYHVVVSKGPEHEIFEQDVTVPAMGAVTVEARVDHVVDTDGWITVDTHVHSTKSVDADESLEQRVLGAVGEGLDILLSTDHDVVIDYQPTVDRLGLTSKLVTERGSEISPLYGHFNAWPLATGKYWEVQWFVYEGETFKRMLDPNEVVALARSKGAAIVQVNHPRDSKGAYNYMQLNPETNMGIKPFPESDCVELMNSKGGDFHELVFADLVGAWKHDRRITATASSDAHSRGSEIGYGRTAIKAGTDLPATWQALREGKAVAMIGPFVTLEARAGTGSDAQKAGIGETLNSNRGPVELDVVVQAPSWMDVDTLEIIRDGVVIATRTLDPGPVVRFRGTITATATADAFFMAKVSGDGRNEPVMGARALTYTNPVFVDVAGNGYHWGQ